jgi:hypothetical protein
MPFPRLILAGLVSTVAVVGTPSAIADPNPDNNQNALVRTLECSNGQTIVASFAGLEGSNFNVTTDESVFVYKWIHIDRLPLGDSPNDDLNVRGLQGFPAERLVTCGYVTGSGSVVEVIGFFTGDPS